MLKMLDKYKIKASFFVPGHTLDSFPEECALIRDAGHEFGLHGVHCLVQNQTETWTDFLPFRLLSREPDRHDSSAAARRPRLHLQAAHRFLRQAANWVRTVDRRLLSLSPFLLTTSPADVQHPGGKTPRYFSIRVRARRAINDPWLQEGVELLLEKGIQYDHSSQAHDCMPFYTRDEDTWTKIDLEKTKPAKEWMKPLVKGKLTPLVTIPAK